MKSGHKLVNLNANPDTINCEYQKKTTIHSFGAHVGYEEDCDERCKDVVICLLDGGYCKCTHLAEIEEKRAKYKLEEIQR